MYEGKKRRGGTSKFKNTAWVEKGASDQRKGSASLATTEHTEKKITPRADNDQTQTFL